MAEFNIEDMRYIPSPFEILQEADLPHEGLMRAHIIDPNDDSNFTVIGYGYGWNRNILFNPNESDRLKVVSFALGETSCDAVIAYILPEVEASDQEERKSLFDQQMIKMRADNAAAIREIRKANQRFEEEEVLENKKAAARLDIMRQAELIPDALELIETEVMTQHPDLHFPKDTDKDELS